MSSSAEDEVWRVLILPGLQQGRPATLRGFTLSGRAGRSQGFLLNDGCLLEVNRFKQAHSAWLSGERFLADGGMFMATPYDPLFVLLPLLDRARDKDDACPAGKFKELDELLYDASAPGLSELLRHALRAPNGCGASARPMEVEAASPSSTGAVGGMAVEAERADGDEQEQRCLVPEASGRGLAQQQHSTPSLEEQLACVCDIRRVDESCYYRLNDQRVLAWLLCKVRQMRAALSAQVTGLDAEHATSYVLAFLSEYVCDPWVGMLARHLGVTDNGPAGTALQPTDGNAQPAPRPTPPPGAGPPEKKQKVDVRAAAKQAVLAKQAVGTKKLTSFFTKK